MKINVNTKQKPKKKTLPDVGDLFTYPNTNNVYMRVGGWGAEKRCVGLNISAEMIPYSEKNIILLKQVGKLVLERID